MKTLLTLITALLISAPALACIPASGVGCAMPEPKLELEGDLIAHGCGGTWDEPPCGFVPDDDDLFGDLLDLLG